jgi:hypothetical protein
MKTQWFADLKGVERDGFKQSVLQSKIVLDKLQQIVYNMYKDKRTVTFSDYSSPSWSHEQAHTNGYCEALQDILALVTIEPKD